MRGNLVLGALASSILWGSFASAEGKLSYGRDVRPILSNHCFQCHGPDDHKRQGGLRFDVSGGALAVGDSGKAAVVPGDAAASELVRRIVSADKDERMPPDAANKPLSAAQVETLKRWIAEGAEEKGHWAFQPVVRPKPPKLDADDWSRTDVDRFLLARLRGESLAPNGPADKATLLRRVTLDLTGLPPTREELAAFVADESPTAYEKVVDRLLASPRYGERMAAPWLDLARYADSNGFQVDSSRRQWPWRDWVIAAFNRNQPFDQFTIEQLAGDMLPDATLQQRIATGFNRNHRLNGEGGLIAEEWRVETVIDRVETTGLTWLGLTFNCCRCHDHKYDPIAQREFYQLFAYFNNVTESGTLGGGANTDPVALVISPEEQTRKTELEAAVAATTAKRAELEKEVPRLVAEWAPTFREQIVDYKTPWRPLDKPEVVSQGGADIKRLDDGSFLAGGKNPQYETYEIKAPLPEGAFGGFLLECLPDESLPTKGVGRYPNGNFVLSKVEAVVTAPSLAQPVAANFVRAEADYSQQGYDISLVVAGRDFRGWAVDGPTKKDKRTAMFMVDKPVAVPADATVTIRLIHHGIDQHNIGRFRISTTALESSKVALAGPNVPDDVKAALEAPADKRTPEQIAALEKHWRANVDNPLKQADVAVAAAKKASDEFNAALPSVMVMVEGPPRQAKLLVRGQYDKPGDDVGPGVPAALPPLPNGAPNNRLGFAQWVADPSNPLTARVWVNRAWEKFFGYGLVKTTENLGSQAEYPSHPELLDWLADEFMRPRVSPAVNGAAAHPWDMKAFQKLLVTSAAYRQASTVTPEKLERDPDNRLLARGPRFRLSAETIRDQALAASGLLVEKIGGPSVRPYMPDGVWDETSVYGDLRFYKADEGEGLWRRTMYTVWKRTAAPPTMLLFDAPAREVCTVKRSRTNTPMQALALLNESTFVEAARKLGERMLVEGGRTDAERLTFGFVTAIGRAPDESELKTLLDGLAADRQLFADKPDEAKKLLTVGAAKTRAELDAVELAAYTMAGNVLLNLDEFVTRD